MINAKRENVKCTTMVIFICFVSKDLSTYTDSTWSHPQLIKNQGLVSSPRPANAQREPLVYETHRAEAFVDAQNYCHSIKSKKVCKGQMGAGVYKSNQLLTFPRGPLFVSHVKPKVYQIILIAT